MAKISLDGLDAMQYDVLKEIGNIGATGNAEFICNNKNAMSMKTLADVKRKMTLGSKWRCVRLFEGGKDLGVREVGKVQGNAVAFLKPDGKLSWLWWPKAKDVQVEENAFTVLQNGVPKLKYIYAG